jgi:SSS family solute:Na+ symporter
MIHLGTLDTILIIGYFGAVIFVGLRAARRSTNTSEDFLLAGRTLTLPLFVATLVSTWYGGILGVGEFSYRYGISNWVVFGGPYYLFALIFALVLARRIRATRTLTIPDQLAKAYDKKTALVGAVLTFVLITPAAYVLMLGVLVQLLFGVDLAISVIIATALTIFYLKSGGLRSDVWVNALEFVLMFLGFAVILPFAWTSVGDLGVVRDNVPALHLVWHGGHAPQYIAVWFFIALWTLVDPAFYQRCSAARDGKTAQKGILLSIVFWFFFDAMTSLTGLYARAALPDLQEPMFSYPMLAELVLPDVFKGLFLIGMLATIMSSLSSLMFIAATTIGNDIVGRLAQPGQRDRLVTRWTRWGLAVAALFAVGLALLVPSVVELWYTIGTTIIPGLLVPVVSTYFRWLRIPPSFGFGAMLTGWGVSTTSLVVGMVMTSGGSPEYVLGIEPMIPGLVASICVWGMGKLWMARNRTAVQPRRDTPPQ